MKQIGKWIIILAIIGIMGWLVWNTYDAYTSFYPIADFHAENVGKTYDHVLVPLDGIIYENCIFHNVIFLYYGRDGIYIYNSTLTGTASIYGPAAVILQLISPLIQDPPTGFQKPDPVPTPQSIEPPKYEM